MRAMLKPHPRSSRASTSLLLRPRVIDHLIKHSSFNARSLVRQLPRVTCEEERYTSPSLALLVHTLLPGLWPDLNPVWCKSSTVSLLLAARGCRVAYSLLFYFDACAGRALLPR